MLSSRGPYLAFFPSLLDAISSLEQVFLEAQQLTFQTVSHALQLSKYQTLESYSKILFPGTNFNNSTL